MDEKPFDRQNAAYVQALYEEFARNPEGVPAQWRDFFALGPQATAEAGLIVPEGLAENGGGSTDSKAGTASPMVAADLSAAPREAHTIPHLLRAVAHATSFIQAYRDHGHQLSTVDPLGSEPPGHPQLDPSFFGTSMRFSKRISERQGTRTRLSLSADDRADTCSFGRSVLANWARDPHPSEFDHEIGREIDRIDRAIIKGDVRVLVEYGGLQAAMKRSVALSKRARRQAGRGLMQRTDTWRTVRLVGARFR